ncbi:MAG: hypothetical protein OXF25_02965 [Cyanobacteria bacterium MAG CAR3_bin_5]|nr:hypothetical protein [Cyanobacteria bacterium MAG CAR3_bin_5]
MIDPLGKRIDELQEDVKEIRKDLNTRLDKLEPRQQEDNPLHEKTYDDA